MVNVFMGFLLGLVVDFVHSRFGEPTRWADPRRGMSGRPVRAVERPDHGRVDAGAGDS